MKIIILIFSTLFFLTGCYTMNTHPEFKSRNENGEMRAFVVSKDTRCLDCHTESELIDYGFVTEERSAELDSIIYNYPYWAGNEEVDVLSLREYQLLHPPEITINVYTPPPPPRPPRPEPRPIPEPVPDPTPGYYPPPPSDSPADDEVTKERKEPEQKDPRRGNSGGRGSRDSDSGGRDRRAGTGR